MPFRGNKNIFQTIFRGKKIIIHTFIHVRRSDLEVEGFSILKYLTDPLQKTDEPW